MSVQIEMLLDGMICYSVRTVDNGDIYLIMTNFRPEYRVIQDRLAYRTIDVLFIP